MRSARQAGFLMFALAALVVAGASPPASAQPTPAPRPAAAAAVASSGSALFTSHCASCHAGSDPRTPTTASLRQRPPEAILDALTTGAMRQQAAALSESERRAVAEYLGGRAIGAGGRPDAATAAIASRCADPSAASVDEGAWTGWSPTTTNTRFQTAPAAGLSVDQIARLKLRWAFGFPDASSARSLPTVHAQRLYVGSQDGTVHALHARTGCTYWTFKARAGVRTPIVVGTGSTAKSPVTLYFGDGRSTVYALNAATGALLWSRSVDDHPAARLTGAPALHGDRLYVPVASVEEGQGNNPKYECCTFRGSIVALNTATGALVWKTYTIDAEPRPIGTNRGGSTRFGPSGAGIWAPPTIDAKRKRLYAATGNMYTEPQQKTSDAVIAFDLDTGRIDWVAQVTPNDVFVVGCNQPNPANCPVGDDLGPDFDFGNAPMLVNAGTRDLIVLGQKSGVGFALDPDKQGAIVWQYRAGKGSALGGMEFGSAADAERVYFPVADGNQPTAGELHAVRLASGERAWMTPPRPVLCGERGRGCTPAILGAITVIPGAVFAGAMDGGLRAYSTADGALLWEFNTNGDFPTVNGVKASGASINGPGPVVAGGMVFVNSGYGTLGGRPGNVLLAFAPD